MPESNLSFFGRLSLAVGTFFSVIGNREFAAGVLRVRDGAPAPVAPAPAPAPVAPAAAPAPAPAPVAPAVTTSPASGSSVAPQPLPPLSPQR